jgi:hypothetical protein
MAKNRVGVFDVRLVIAVLFGAYGLVLTVLGIGFTPDQDIDRSAGVNINLWAGIGMLAFAGAFALWARLRPLTVPEHKEDGGAEAPPSE